MGANEAKDTSDENIPPEVVQKKEKNIPPEVVQKKEKNIPPEWWESSNYSRSTHELFTGVIMAVQIYNHTVFEYMQSPLFLSYFSFGILELCLACRLRDDSNWIWGFCKVSGRISHAIGSYIILTFIPGWRNNLFVRYIGTLFLECFVGVILLTLCGLRRPMETDNNVADSKTGQDTEFLHDDNHAQNISEIPWWESVVFGRIMYELILGANLVLIAHYHIRFEIYFLPSIFIFYCLLYEFGKPSSAAWIIGRCLGQMIGVMTASYFIYCHISPVFALVLQAVSFLWHFAIIGYRLERVIKNLNREALSELIIVKYLNKSK